MRDIINEMKSITMFLPQEHQLSSQASLELDTKLTAMVPNHNVPDHMSLHNMAQNQRTPAYLCSHPCP